MPCVLVSCQPEHACFALLPTASPFRRLAPVHAGHSSSIYAACNPHPPSPFLRPMYVILITAVRERKRFPSFEGEVSGGLFRAAWLRRAHGLQCGPGPSRRRGFQLRSVFTIDARRRPPRNVPWGVKGKHWWGEGGSRLTTAFWKTYAVRETYTQRMG